MLNDIAQSGELYLRALWTDPAYRDHSHPVMQMLITKGLTRTTMPLYYRFGYLPLGTNPAWEYDYPSIFNRLLIPIYDVYGTLVAISARKVYEQDTGQKFWLTYGFNKRRHLWGLNVWESVIPNVNYCFVVESFFDGIALASFGYPVVAYMGSSMSPEQAALLARYTDRVCYLMHADKTEKKDVDMVMQPLLSAGHKVLAAACPYKDYGDYYAADYTGAHGFAQMCLHQLCNTRPVEVPLADRMR